MLNLDYLALSSWKSRTPGACPGSSSLSNARIHTQNIYMQTGFLPLYYPEDSLLILLLQKVNYTWSFYMETQSEISFLCGKVYISFTYKFINLFCLCLKILIYGMIADDRNDRVLFYRNLHRTFAIQKPSCLASYFHHIIKRKDWQKKPSCCFVFQELSGRKQSGYSKYP